MEIDDLLFLHAVVSEGNFTKASRALRIAQPAISRRVKRLEDSLGAALLIRHKRHVEATPVGNAVLRCTKQIFESLEQIRALSDSKSLSAIEGPLRIVTADSVASHWLPEWVARFCDAHPKVLPMVRVGASGELLKSIQAGEADLGIFFYVPRTGDAILETRPLMKVPHRLVVRKASSRDMEVLSSFIGSREIDSPSHAEYPTLGKLRKKYPSARIRYSSNSLAMHKELVLLGKGVAILPELLISSELKRKQLADVLPGERFLFDMSLVTCSARPLRPVAERFVAFMRGHDSLDQSQG